MENEIQKMKVESINRMSSLVGNLIAEAINYSKIVECKPVLEEDHKDEEQKPAGKEILTLKEAAEYMSLSMSYMYKLSHWNKIRSYKPAGKVIYYKKADLHEWMLQNPTKLQHEIDAIVAKEIGTKQKRKA